MSIPEPAAASRCAPAEPSVVMALLPIVAAVFVGYLVIGIAMPVLPLHVHEGLGRGAFLVGVVSGAQFTASLLSRFWSGTYADTRGGKRAVVIGLVVAAAALYAVSGFGAVGVATTLVPVATLLLVLPRAASEPSAPTRRSFTQVIGAVWRSGLGLALSCVGFGAITTFIVLIFAEKGWGQAWLAFTVLSVAFAGARVVLGHLPDRIGGARCALYSVLIEAAGQAMIWLAPWRGLALIGAALSGLGYALVYPGFGIEAVRCAPLENRGLATGAYTAFLDLALGIAGPALGLVASGFGLGAVFLVSTVVVLGGAGIALSLVRTTHGARS